MANEEVLELAVAKPLRIWIYLDKAMAHRLSCAAALPSREAGGQRLGEDRLEQHRQQLPIGCTGPGQEATMMWS